MPLGEESEKYLLKITQGGTVIREEMPDGPEFIYSAAMRAADGLSGVFDVEVAQVSASFGPGDFAVLPQSA